MKIRFLSPSPKAGQVEHIQPHLAQPLIVAGLAEHIPYKNYRERLSEEASVGSDPSNTNANVVGVEWGVVQPTHPLNPPCIIRKTAHETLYFDGPPDEKKYGKVPAGVLAQFRALKDEPQPSGFSKEAAVKQEFEQREREKAGVAAVIHRGR